MSADTADLLLDANDDLAIVNGDFVVASGADAVAQGIRSRLRLFRGEWFLDESEGVPYFDEVFVKSPKLGLLRESFRRIIAESPGVASVDRCDLTFDKARRKLSVSWQATADDGALLVSDGVQIGVP